MTSQRDPNAVPRASRAFRSAVRLCTLGITRARPKPFTAQRPIARWREVVQAKSVVNVAQMQQPTAMTDPRG
jgi:hypothetical protein